MEGLEPQEVTVAFCMVPWASSALPEALEMQVKEQGGSRSAIA